MSTAVVVSLAAAFALVAAVSARPAPLTLRVVSYNLHHGEGVDKKLDLERIAKAIAELKPDLVALQEVDVKTRRTGQVDQVARYGELTGLHATFGKSMDYDGGGYGNAILSRFPIRLSKTHPLPSEAEHEPRSVLEVRVRPSDDGPEIAFLSTHLNHRDGGIRTRQAQKIADLFGKEQGPVILAGDLNATPESLPVKALVGSGWTDATAGRGVLTIPVEKATRQIDFVLMRPAGRFHVVEARSVPERVASDHLPVLAILELKSQ
ncbi:MAG: endonuclease/exonuclease/phosphatase family protein [Gemmataceae bacterium]